MSSRPRSPRALTAAMVALLVGALLLASCGGGGDKNGSGNGASGDPNKEARAGEPKPGGTLRYGLGAETSGWNPTKDRWGTAGNEVAKALFDPLAAYDADFGVHPYLAESIEPNDDYTEWTITVRPGVTFHNGDPLDAQAVKTNLDAHLDSALTGPALEPVEGIDVIDDRSVVVRMSTPWVHFPNILTGQGGNVAAPAMLSDPEGASNPIGTGPFELDHWTPDKELVVTRYDDYWREGFPYLDSIKFIPINDNLTRLQTFDAGDLDINPTAIAEQVADLQEQADAGEIQLFVDTKGETLENFVQMNTAVEPFDDERVRMAMALAIDKEALNETLFEGVFETADGIFGKQSRWYTGVDAPGYDPERAKELVDEYEEEVGPIEFEYIGTDRVEDTEIRSFLKSQWDEVGIDAELINLDSATHLVRVVGGNYQATNFSLFTSPHPDSDYPFLHSAEPCEIGAACLNLARFSDDELDAALETARGSDDPEVVKEQYAIVNERLAERVPYVFLWHSLDAVAAQNNVADVTTWTLPDTEDPGMPLLGAIHPLYQLWLTNP